MAESKEELKRLLMKVKEESEKANLKLNVQKTKFMASGLITSWQINGGKNGNSDKLYFLGLHNYWRWWLKLRHLLLGRKSMTNLDSMLKSRVISLLPNVYLVKAMVFPVIMYMCKNWTIKKAEYWRTDAFELWCWRRLLQVPWTARRSHQTILK